MNNRALLVLELGKVLNRFADFAVSESGKQHCIALRPYPTLEEVQRQSQLFHEAQLFFIQSGLTITAFSALELVWQELQKPTALLEQETLWVIRNTLAQGATFRTALETPEQDSTRSPWPLLQAMSSSHPFPQQSIAGLTRCINDDGHIKDEASPELSLVRSELRRLHQQCTQKAKGFINQYNLSQYLQEEYITLASDRYVLPLKSSFKGRIQGIIHDYSQTGETCYFEPYFMVELNNHLRELKQEERTEERKVLQYLTDLLRSESPALQSLYKLLVELDILRAKCLLAAAYGTGALEGRMLEFGHNGSICLYTARHPLLAITAHSSPQERSRHKAQAIPLHIELNPQHKVLIISGGNAGGKTVTLKTLGLTALMGLCGLPVAVGAGSHLPFWHDIWAFIGDEQSLEEQVSTFTAQIEHLAQAWQVITTNSLVILDEFGAGTDPAQGAALAQAVIESLQEKGAHVIVATHFPSLKTYALSNESVRAASVLFDPSTQKPLFKLAYDQIGSSLAFDVAKEYGLPVEIVQRAEEHLLMRGEDTSKLIERLNELAIAKENALDKLTAQEEKLHAERNKLQQRFEDEKKKLFANLQKQAQGVLKEWKSGQASHKQTLKKLAELRTELITSGTEENKAELEIHLEDVQPGVAVQYTPWNKKGTVLDIDLRRQRIQLDFAGISLWAAAKDIVLNSTKSEPSTTKAHPNPNSRHAANNTPPALRLDLRGMRADVALNELSKFLDSALLQESRTMEIIHGRGTGALRREVHEFLEQYPLLESFRLAPENQGGDGVTLVELQ